MKIRVSFCKKIGQPNYGSIGASCELEIDVPEATASDNPTSLVAEIRRAYDLARLSVEEQLVGQPATADAPPPAPAPARESNGHAEHAPRNYRPNRITGKSLYGLAKDLGRLNEVMEFGRAEDYPERIMDWSDDEAKCAAEILDQPAPTARSNGRRRAPSRN